MVEQHSWISNDCGDAISALKDLCRFFKWEVNQTLRCHYYFCGVSAICNQTQSYNEYIYQITSTVWLGVNHNKKIKRPIMSHFSGLIILASFSDFSNQLSGIRKGPHLDKQGHRFFFFVRLGLPAPADFPLTVFVLPHHRHTRHRKVCAAQEVFFCSPWRMLPPLSGERLMAFVCLPRNISHSLVSAHSFFSSTSWPGSDLGLQCIVAPCSRFSIWWWLLRLWLFYFYFCLGSLPNRQRRGSCSGKENHYLPLLAKFNLLCDLGFLY